MEGFSDGSSTLPASTKAEPDEPSRFAWLLLCPNGLYDRRDICPGVSTCLCQEIKKEATTQGIPCVVASFFVFSHSHNGFRYNLPKSSEILKSLLESTVKEHGYD